MKPTAKQTDRKVSLRDALMVTKDGIKVNSRQKVLNERAHKEAVAAVRQTLKKTGTKAEKIAALQEIGAKHGYDALHDALRQINPGFKGMDVIPPSKPSRTINLTTGKK